MAFFVNLFWLVACLQCTYVVAFKCHKFCNCEEVSLSSGYKVLCEGTPDIARANATDNFGQQIGCKSVLHIESLNFNFPISDLRISCLRISSPEKLVKFSDLKSLTVTNTNVTDFSINFIQRSINLNKLNLSSNGLKYFKVPTGVVLAKLESLDLSNNTLIKVDIDGKAMPQVQLVNVQDNHLTSTVFLESLHSVAHLDISGNSFIDSFNLTRLENIQTLTAKKVDAVFKFNANTPCSNCPILPKSAADIYLQYNSLLQVPRCDGLLAGLSNLRKLQLDYNKISILFNHTFDGHCFSKLQMLHLSHNWLVKVSGGSLVPLASLQVFDVSYNHLQHLDLQLVKGFGIIADNYSVLSSNLNTSAILLHNNSWSCDCFLTSLQDWVLKTPHARQVFVCQQPILLQSYFLEDIASSDLTCSNASITVPNNVTAVEFLSGTLLCQVTGLPKPIVHWITPKNETVSLASIASSSNQQDSFSLSEFGEMLTVHNVRLHKTGFYRCVANNNVSSTEATVTLGVLLGQTSTIVLLSVACFAFMIAVVVNSINMCVYICEHLEKKRLYKKALQAQKEQEKQNPPIKLRSRSLDESMASLNANRHYSRYDFTCQQMFLDTVVKGAHSVKKTLYDARHSEFSANMWGYASNLRDRLHIEMPSGVQLPSISMPSISMPSISMPTMPQMPTMQDININIERLGSSVMQRSHTLATSVGSVFTRRWMWQSQNNSSDNESRDSDENLVGKPGVTQVCVDVHSQQERRHSGSVPATPSTAQPSTSRGDGLQHFYHQSFQRSKSFTKNVQPVLESRIQRQMSYDHPSTNAIVTVHPNLNTISGTLDTMHFHSYETSV